ncbi:MAG: NAD(P)/FAD-dependent oxidoreductase [Hyphomonadaceae bacterium]|nr:NAD(P)/FAD-dependent oxidoreductase [Hyphomonadaceae bacterium]
MEHVDALVLGGGAAGLFCGGRLAQRGRRVRVLDHSRKPAEKIRISGGGRCNFTNLETEPKCFLSENPHFAKSALARYTPWDFCSLMAEHGLTWHEKTLGQLFCDQKSGAVIDMLIEDLTAAGGVLALDTSIHEVRREGEAFRVQTSAGPITCDSLIVATGGLSIPKIGATGFAYELAQQFGHEVIPPRPALVPMTFTDDHRDAFSDMSGVSLAVEARAERGPGFAENMLFTHRGLSGPSVLQVSSYWHQSEAIAFDLLPGMNAIDLIRTAKADTPKQPVSQFLSQHFPGRFANYFPKELGLEKSTRLAELSNHQIDQFGQALKDWTLKPAGTEGWRTAEVTAGGVATDGLSSRTMESKFQPGLFFIGECVDVTGWLGGYNFQWAWASAAAAAEVA